MLWWDIDLQHTMSQAAEVFGALAVAEASSAATMLKDMMEKLLSEVGQLAGTTPGRDAMASGTLTGSRDMGDTARQRSRAALNGYALGVAALLGASTR
jgi:hypothetical protein